MAQKLGPARKSALSLALCAGLVAGVLPARTDSPAAAEQANRQASGQVTKSMLQVPAAVPASGAVGNDISWPNCPKGMGVVGRRTQGLPLPDPAAQYVIIGLTNGRAFTRNPCLASHLQVAASRDLATSAYTMLSYPNPAERRRYAKSGPYSSRTIAGQVANFGYAQAKFALETMSNAGLAAPLVWIDVEPRAERRWSASKTNNRSLVKGALRAASDRGVTSGIYTYANAWKAIVGNWQVAAPLWAPSHTRSRTYAAKKADAVASCARVGFTGGPLVITQWVHGNRDYNVICPLISATSYPYFLRFVSDPASATPSPTPTTASPTLTTTPSPSTASPSETTTSPTPSVTPSPVTPSPGTPSPVNSVSESPTPSFS